MLSETIKVLVLYLLWAAVVVSIIALFFGGFTKHNGPRQRK